MSVGHTKMRIFGRIGNGIQVRMGVVLTQLIFVIPSTKVSIPFLSTTIHTGHNRPQKQATDSWTAMSRPYSAIPLTSTQ